MPPSSLSCRSMRHLSGTFRLFCAGLLATAIFLPPIARAHANERLLVLMAVDRRNETEWPPWSRIPDVEGELTELAVAATARETDCELVGLRDLRQKMGAAFPARLDACLQDRDCLMSLVENANSARVAIGRAGWSDGRFVLRLALIHPKTAETQQEWLSPPVKDLPQLNSALRQGFHVLFMPARALSARDPEAGKQSLPSETHPSPGVTSVSIDPPAAAPAAPARRADEHITLLPALAYASLALAAVAFSAAIVTGSLGEAAPTGSTRAETQNDLHRRSEYANTANGLLLAGSLSAVAGIGALGWIYWRTHWREP